VGTDNRTNAIDLGYGILKIRLERCIDCILERLGSPGHLHDGRTQNLHPAYVRSFFLDINRTHVNITLKTEQGGCSGKGNPMLTGTGLCDHLLLSQLLGQQRFSDTVIDLMCSGMVQVLTLEINLSSSDCFTQPSCMVDRRWTSNVMFLETCQFA